jgi:hypothetical protein
VNDERPSFIPCVDDWSVLDACPDRQLDELDAFFACCVSDSVTDSVNSTRSQVVPWFDCFLIFLSSNINTSIFS